MYFSPRLRKKCGCYILLKGRMILMAKKTDKEKSALSSMQAVTYQREFKMADRAGGFMDRKGRK